MLLPAQSAHLDAVYSDIFWDGWASGNVDGQTKYYAQGAGHLYFDVVPLKYTSWDDYQSGVVPVQKDFKGIKFTINDDLKIHPAGNSLGSMER